MPSTLSVISSLTASIAWSTPLPPQRALSPSRFSTASCAPGRCARRHRRATEAAVIEQHVDLHRRIAPAVEDLARMDVDDCGHVTMLLDFALGRARSTFIGHVRQSFCQWNRGLGDGVERRQDAKGPAMTDTTIIDDATIDHGGPTPQTPPACRSQVDRRIVKDSATKYGAQAADKAREFADTGKQRATGALDQLSQMLHDAAGQVDEKLGGAIWRLRPSGRGAGHVLRRSVQGEGRRRRWSTMRAIMSARALRSRSASPPRWASWSRGWSSRASIPAARRIDALAPDRRHGGRPDRLDARLARRRARPAAWRGRRSRWSRRASASGCRRIRAR